MKIAILTFHRACNYGAVLQAYALQTALNSIDGADAYILDYNSPGVYEIYGQFGPLKRKAKFYKNWTLLALMAGSIAKRNRCFGDFRKRCFRMERNNLSRKELPQAIRDYDCVIVGSDQVWNSELTGDDDTFLLDFVPDAVRKFSYAASMGRQKMTDAEMEKMASFLERFEIISLREPTFVSDFGKRLHDKEIRCDVDPVFLLHANQWRALARKKKQEPYVLYFTLGSGKEDIPTKEFAKRLAQEQGLKTVYFSADTRWFRFRDLEHYPISAPEDFLGLIDGAEFVVTSSFHATAFSIILHKSFFVDSGVVYHSRIQNLLEITGLTDRGLRAGGLSSSPSPIDWERVDARLAESIADSKEYLWSVVNGKQVSSFEI